MVKLRYLQQLLLGHEISVISTGGRVMATANTSGVYISNERNC